MSANRFLAIAALVWAIASLVVSGPLLVIAVICLSLALLV